MNAAAQVQTDPNACPAIPGRRSATVNAHGDLPPGSVIRVVTRYANSFYVDREQLAGTDALLRVYHKSGRLRGRMNRRARTFTHADPLNRENIAFIEGCG